MNPLLYSSNEMFSSTELIRKSKMIFDKLLSSEIEKAIVLRDGKPGFMLLEFSKYEEVMKEYLELKKQVDTKSDVIENIEIKEDIIEPNQIETVEEVLPTEELVEETVTVETSEEQFEHIENDISEDDLKKALEDIDKLTTQEEKEGKDIKEFDDMNLDLDDELDELSNQKKDQLLKEFWD